MVTIVVMTVMVMITMIDDGDDSDDHHSRDDDCDNGGGAGQRFCATLIRVPSLRESTAGRAHVTNANPRDSELCS